MSVAVFFKLLAIFGVVGLGWFAGRMRWLGDERQGADPARTLSNAAFYIFIPALLFRTTSRIDFATLPWGLLAAFFGPVLLMLLGVYAWQRRLHRGRGLPAAVAAHRQTTTPDDPAIRSWLRIPGVVILYQGKRPFSAARLTTGAEKQTP